MSMCRDLSVFRLSRAKEGTLMLVYYCVVCGCRHEDDLDKVPFKEECMKDESAAPP